MRIAITAQGRTWNDRMDERFGRAGGFFIIDTETSERGFIENSIETGAAHGAGTGAAQLLVSERIDLLITGRVGPKAWDALRAAQIEILQIDGELTIAQAYEHYQKQLT